MNESEKLRARLAKLFDLPQNIILNLPMITLVGNLNLQVENHRGLIKYNPELIKVKVKQGKLIITGQNLMIDQLGTDKLIITGNIDNLSFDLF